MIPVRKAIPTIEKTLGSTVAVTDGVGNLVQTTGYYPSGTPYKLPSEAGTDLDAVTEKLHIGNKWIGHKGFDLYDNTARMHDPLLARFHSVDPLFGNYPGSSPWTHCLANPLSLVDPTGCDTISVNNNGYFSVTSKTKDNFDILVGRNNSYIRVDKGDLIPVTEFQANGHTDDYKITSIFSLYSINNNATALFEFLALNTDVEWSIITSKDNNLIGTMHYANGESTLTHLKNDSEIYSNISYFCHSHTREGYASTTDMAMVADLYKNNGNVRTQIFVTPTREYIDYNTEESNLRNLEVTAPAPKNKPNKIGNVLKKIVTIPKRPSKL